MRIYNEVILHWNDVTNQFDTFYEDFEEYDGPIALAQGAPPHSTAISDTDTIADTTKTTAGYFTDEDGTLLGTQIYTGSLLDSNENYYFNVNHKQDDGPNKDATSKTQFSVAFGHIAGSGSDQYGDSTDNPKNIIGETQAIYKQYINILMESVEGRDGFKISQQGSSGVLSSDVVDSYIYVLNLKRDLFKERVNKKGWTLILSGSTTTGSAARALKLTDDSKNQPATATPAGPRYNIISGALGSTNLSASQKTYGWFYPDRGTMVFSGVELSASIPGGPTFGHGHLMSSSGVFATFTSSQNSLHGQKIHFSSSDSGWYSSVNAGDMIHITSKSTADTTNLIAQVVGKGREYAQGEDPTIITGIITASAQWPGSGSETAAAERAPTEHRRAVDIAVMTPTTDISASFSITDVTRASSSGFAPNLYNKQGSGESTNNALRFVNCMRNVGNTDSVFQLRSEEDATQESYFCRIKSDRYNFTANQTFVSGGLNKIRHTSMHGNPTTFITGIGLYNTSGELLAMGQLSKPLKKNFASEATIKVKLTY